MAIADGRHSSAGSHYNMVFKTRCTMSCKPVVLADVALQRSGSTTRSAHAACVRASMADQLNIGDCRGQGLMYTYALGVDSLERKAAENFALYFRRRQASTRLGKQSAAQRAQSC